MQQEIKSKLADEPVFTPLDASQRQRLRFKASDVEVISGDPSIRRLGHRARVRIGLAVFDVFGCPCDLDGCNCVRTSSPSHSRGRHERWGQAD
jgi:hypothetical protein